MSAEAQTPDPWAPLLPELTACADSPWFGAPCDVWLTPPEDGRSVPADVLADGWQLPDLPSTPRPQPSKQLRERTQFQRIIRAAPTEQAWEIVRVGFTAPGYLSRIATFLEVSIIGGAVVYISNDLADPDPFPLVVGQENLTLVWHIRYDETIGYATGDPPWITAAPAQHIPTAHTVGDLNSSWADMRYHWGQRPPNKLARIERPGHVRLFVEVQGTIGTSVRLRVGGQLGGWEGK